MDIRNILNHNDRRHLEQQQQQQQPSPSTAPQSAPLPPPPQYSAVAAPPPPYPYPHPQQIVYTGPVYQLPPPLPPPVAGAFQYRYNAYYEQSADCVYRQYGEHPPQPSVEIRYNSAPPRTTFRRHQYDRDSLISRVVPVEGGFQYRPQHPHPHPQHFANARYADVEYQRAEYRPHSPHSPHSKRLRRPPPPPVYYQYTPSHPKHLQYHPSSYQPSEESCDAAQPRLPLAKKEEDVNDEGQQQEQRSSDEVQSPKKRVPRRESKDDHEITGRNTRDTANLVKEESVPECSEANGGAVKVARKRTKIRQRAERNEYENVEIGPNHNSIASRHRAGSKKTPNFVDTHSQTNTNQQPPSTPDWSSDDDRALIHHRNVLRAKARAKRLKRNRDTPTHSNQHTNMSLENNNHSDATASNGVVSSSLKKERVLVDDHLPLKKKRRLTKTLPVENDPVQPVTTPENDDERIAIESTTSYESNIGSLPPFRSSSSPAQPSPADVRLPARSSPPTRVKKASRIAKARIPRPRKFIPPVIDPDEPYPVKHTDFGGLSSQAVGDMLQVWDFVTSFSKTLRISPFKLLHLEQAISHEDRCTLLDACILRLVQTIVSDRGLVAELRIPDQVVKAVRVKSATSGLNTILDNLANIVSDESAQHDDPLLLATIAKLKPGHRMAFYRTIHPDGKIRILRELVDYAAMTDILRECVTDSMDHAEEERKKARGENSANRKKQELRLKELRQELLDYKIKHGLLDNACQADSEKAGANSAKDSGSAREESCGPESRSTSTDKDEPLTRQEKLLAVQKERREQEERRSIERGAEAIIVRMDKVKANLKSLKNVRLRNRSKDDDPLERSDGTSQPLQITDMYEDLVRTYHLGVDREERCYWYFSGSGRLWVEETKTLSWFCFKEKEDIMCLLRWLSSYRKSERRLRRNIQQRLEAIENEFAQEKKWIAEAEAEEKEAAAAEASAPTTRAGKRRASQEAKQKQKGKPVLLFKDYRNSER